MKEKKFDTRLIHSGERGAKPGEPVVPGIDLSTTFVRGDPAAPQPFIYSRGNNPNRRLLERRLASLENGFDAAAFASGSAATLALCQTLPAGSHVIVTEDAYWGTTLLMRDLLGSLGHTLTAVDTTEVDNLARAWRDDTHLVWLETPSNPQMKVSDITAIAEMCHARGAVLCCDNTVATSVMQNPLQFGADFSMHSTTKFVGGHSDVTGGVVIARDDTSQFARLRDIQALTGATPSPFDCWLLTRSLATLSVRVRRQSESAATLASFLVQHPHVDGVHYPGLAAHPQAGVIDRQMCGGGGVLSMLITGGPERALAVARGTQLIKQATSLGGVESLIEHRRSVEGDASLSPNNLLRLSVGLEDPDDLRADLEQALA